ncbi:hypothetical protein HNY73_021115 [Argiope bruennichi]|uniref:DUF5641 domain-containing protein n=1 Tax=Argiope bruennichi TaxID=94029 RepID=A0A8T0EA84_ARGBR|nr:hypothetical protein HNY73_021115 [Argiope bruennichi]
MLEALVIEIISNLSLNIPDDSILSELKTKNIQLADSFDKGVPVEILVGSDSFWEVVYDQRERVCQNTWVINSVFGWLIGGVGKRDDSTESCENVCLVMDSSSILFELNKFWEIEEFPNEIRGLSERDDHLIKTFENNLKFNGKRYVCKLMWKDNMGPPVELDSNFEVAERRFNSMERKLNKNPEIADQYKKIVKDQLECDIVGKCVYKDTRTGYYMPHRAVIRDDKATTQVRIVYDCSKIAEEDRKYLKFLWFPDDTGGSKQVFNFNRLPFGLTTSPFALACVLKFHIRKFRDKYPKCCEMLNSLYVDDLYYGADTAQDAYQLTSSAIDILRSAGFNLRKLRTNCVELNKLWFENGYKENTDHGQGSGFLGLNWDPIEDEIKLNLKDVRNSLEFGITNGTSKRHVLRVISQIFDPCGLISPFVITVKILIQELWKRSLEWDEQLPQDLEEKWNTWCSELSAIDNLRIERKLFTKLRTNDISLHIFCDASPKAYGAVAYFRYITEEGSAKVSFIMSKSKVAPLKTLTLARLELMAALIGARLAKYLQDTFPSLIKRVYLWSDSKIVIHWVKGSAKIWKPFVCNRVTQVQLLTSPLCWNHCSGSENPADLTTRGESAKAFLSSSLWWTGPEWLSRPVHSWPVQCSSILSDSICDKEIFSSERRRTETVNTMVVTTNVDDCISSCINIDKYSNLRKLLRVTAFVKRFMNNSKPRSLKFSGPLSAFELQEALHSWIKATQIKYFGAEIHQLLSKSVISKDSCVYNLSPELDENNLLQLKGRLQFFSGDMRAKHPWLLPSNDKFVKLLILDAHFKMGHLGVEGTLTHLREQFWIIKGRQFVKKANSELSKWWKYINNPEVKNVFASKGIVWKFIVERSPWWGGFWERQIRTIKTCLKKIIGKSSLSFKELETIFLEIEAIVNSRPITYLYNEPSEPSPLTPSHFLIGKRLASLPVIQSKIEELNVNRDSLTKRIKYQQTILNHFWNRWRKEYLLNLRSAYISPQPGKICSFKVNDVVLINDERYPRNMWMIGRILELCPGRDGQAPFSSHQNSQRKHKTLSSTCLQFRDKSLNIYV